MTTHITRDDNRRALLSGLPATDRRISVNGLTTAIVEGGSGPPVVLLHGPGESAAWWMRVIPRLVSDYTVIAPDLPGHGATEAGDDVPDEKLVLGWLGELIEKTCPTKPVLVGHILGGAIAARFAVRHEDRLRQLVLVDSLGLGKFRPSPGFAFRLVRFMIRPTRTNYTRFLPHCMKDVDDLREEMGARWEPFLAYNLERAADAAGKKALRALMGKVGVPKIPDDDLAGIDIPVTLIWGRDDRANDLSIAEESSERFGWPLYVVEDARDDPKLERPDSFMQAFVAALETGSVNGRQTGITAPASAVT